MDFTTRNARLSTGKAGRSVECSPVPRGRAEPVLRYFNWSLHVQPMLYNDEIPAAISSFVESVRCRERTLVMVLLGGSWLGMDEARGG